VDIGGTEFVSKRSSPIPFIWGKKPDKCKSTDAACYVQP